MKVAWFHQFGGPELLVHEEAPKPSPNEKVSRLSAI